MFSRTIFSKRIKLLRKSYKFTLIEFASYFKIVSKATIGFWEKENAIPSADVLADLSTFLVFLWTGLLGLVTYLIQIQA